MGNSYPNSFRIILLPRVQKSFERIAKRNASLHERIEEQLVKLTREPYLGKPLRHDLKNRRRLHVGSFVILYEIRENKVEVVDFDHHDKIYK